MLRIIREGTTKEQTTYKAEFSFRGNPETGFVFPATEAFPHQVDFAKLTEEDFNNYKWCVAHPEKVSGPHFISDTLYIKESAIGKCQCGTEFPVDRYLHKRFSCSCSHWYNILGHWVKIKKFKINGPKLLK